MPPDKLDGATACFAFFMLCPASNARGGLCSGAVGAEMPSRLARRANSGMRRPAAWLFQRSGLSAAYFSAALYARPPPRIRQAGTQYVYRSKTEVVTMKAGFSCIAGLENKILFDISFRAAPQTKNDVPCLQLRGQKRFSLDLRKRNFVRRKGVTTQIPFSIGKTVF